MSLNFRAVPEPGIDTVGLLAELDPSNPFCTNEYVMVRRKLGSKPCALIVEDNNRIVTGCVGFLTEGRFNARLEVTSLPTTAEPGVFWRGLLESSRRMGVSVLSVNSFASTAARIRETSGRVWHHKRAEYRLDLTVPDPRKQLDRRHQRLTRKAASAGLELTRSGDEASRWAHVALANLSLNRLRVRGESIDSEITLEMVNAFLDCGAGEIFQTTRDGEVFSSLLVARSRTGGYAQSSGTSDAGRNLGASHFLFLETACRLQSEGIELFNLGGAGEKNTGLREFKLGFGSTRIDLESAEFYTGGLLRKVVTRTAGLLRR